MISSVSYRFWYSDDLGMVESATATASANLYNEMSSKPHLNSSGRKRRLDRPEASHHRSRGYRAGEAGPRSSLRSLVSPAQTPRVLAMFAHGLQSRPGRGSRPGSISPALPQDRNLSRRIRLLHLAAPHDGERGADATAQEGLAR